MPRYFATFIPGTGEIVAAMLRRRLKDLKLTALLDGAVEFETGVPYSDLNLFCFNNVFEVLHRGAFDSLEDYLRALPAAQPDWAAARRLPARVKTFRLVTSHRNRLVSVDAAGKRRLEAKIAQATGLKPDRSHPDTEFWLLARSEGLCFFLKRLSRHTAYDRQLAPGELHPELAYMLCWLSEPLHTDVVLDPFCGSGAIPCQRVKRFPFRTVYAFDRDAAAVRRAGEKLAGSPRIVLAQQDVRALSDRLPAASVDAVITDPPWGLFEDVGDIAQFYRESLAQLNRVLKPGGRMVLLTAKKEELAAAVAALPMLTLQKRYDILVSGKKAAIFRMEKAR